MKPRYKIQLTGKGSARFQKTFISLGLAKQYARDIHAEMAWRAAVLDLETGETILSL